jgi:cell wall-associated NlpC family hydrolase
MVAKIGGGGISTRGIDAQALAELEELKEQLAKGVTGQAESEVTTPARSGVRGDRQGAMARISGGIAGGILGQKLASASVQATRGVSADDAQLDKQLTAQLQKLGYLPPPPAKIDAAALDAATRKAIEDALKTLDRLPPGGELPNDMEALLALVESKLQRQNARANGGGGARPGAPTQRPASLPPASTYASRGPAPNQAALQQSALRSIETAKPPPPPGSINARVAEAARNYMGTSTAAGPDGGNLACAWSVNNILANAGIKKVGSNTNYVPSVEQDLQNGRGTAIDAKDAQPGDIVIWPHGHHIGIAMGNGQVADNSSSRASFTNLRDLPAGARVYRLNS